MPTAKRCPWVPSVAHIDTGRLCSAGSRNAPVPRRHRSYAALRLPASSGHHAGSPCGGLPRGRRLFCALWADDPCACKRVVRRRRGIGAPQHRWFLREEVRASQVTRPSSSDVLWSNTPPDIIPSSPIVAGDRCGLRVFPHARHPESISFGAAVPRPARSPAYASPLPFLTPSQGWRPAGRPHP